MPHRIERDLALPTDLFVDEAVFELELGEIWHRDWVFAAPTDALREPGDYVPVRVGRHEVIVLRDQFHQLHAMSNVCAHRGTMLVAEPGNGSRFSCPYHAWTYNDQGELLSVPYAGLDEIDKTRHCLPTYNVAEWHGLVFVTVDPEPEPIDKRLSVVEPYVGPLGIDRLHHRLPALAHTWNANWKVVFADAIDTYSHFRVHPDTVEPHSPTDGAYLLAGSARASVLGGEAFDRGDWLMVAIPPSFVAVIWPHGMTWRAIRPTTVGHTLVEVGVAGETILDEEASHTLVWEDDYVDEDRAICERVQRSAGAASAPGPLLGQERTLGDFHDYLAWKLVGQPPEQPTVHALPGDRPV